MTEVKAFLAPVPLQHLESGVGVCDRYGTVIFGSDRYTLFDDRGVAAGAPVYIYASLTNEVGTPMVTWQAEFVRYIRHEEMLQEDRRRRPPTTDAPGEGTWAGFWEVRDLRLLDDPFPVADLSTEEGKSFNQVFIPRGPTPTRG
jgi:hypothetical protein